MKPGCSWQAYNKRASGSSLFLKTYVFSVKTDGRWFPYGNQRSYPLFITFIEPLVFHERLKFKSIIRAVFVLLGVISFWGYQKLIMLLPAIPVVIILIATIGVYGVLSLTPLLAACTRK